MRNIILLTIIFLLPIYFYGQCDFTIKQPLPSPYNEAPNAALTPADCSAKNDYGTYLFTILYPSAPYLETKYKIREVTETVSDGCSVTTISTRIDTFDIITQVVTPPKTYARQKWVIRLELLTYLPKSRPEGCEAIRLSLSSGKVANYIVTYYDGNFSSKYEAENAIKGFKSKYPGQFCEAYAWLIPSDIEEQYRYFKRSLPTATNK